jgi:hypothetical protein
MPGSVCGKCGSKLEKVCGDCGSVNAVENNSCGKCGTPLTLKGGQPAEPSAAALLPDQAKKSKDTAKFQFEMQPIQDTVSEKEESFANSRLGKSFPEPMPLPPASMSPAPAAPPIPPRPDKIQMTSRISFSVRKTYSVLAIIGLLVVLCFVLYLIAAPYIPRFSLKMTANNYLKKLSAGRYEEAYAMLSINSKAACPMQNFIEYSGQYYGEVPHWEFGGVEIAAMESDAAMVRYQLKEGTSPWRTDYISFVKEHNKWMRPYIWMLFEPIDNAIAKQDFPQALFLAQKLYLTDPMDPRTSGYLCVSEFSMGLYDKSVDSCRRTVFAASVYPVGFTSEEVFWFRFYYADSLRFIQKLESALEEYGAMLKSEEISSQEQCPLYLSRADAYVKLNRYNEAINDMLTADSACTDVTNSAEVVRRMWFLNGGARADAIAFAKRTKPRVDLPSFGELRRKELEAIAARLGPNDMEYMPKDEWVAAHLAGPEYRVILREGILNPRTWRKDVKNVYVFMVNLWTGVIKLEQGVVPSKPAAPVQKQ